MEALDIIIDFIDIIKNKIYLPSSYFDVPNELLEKSVNKFKTDWVRWYPETTISFEKLYCTPQLIAVLCYRIARELYLNAQCAENEHFTPPLHTSPAADAFSILGRQIGLAEIYYSADIGEGFKINHGLGTVIGARCRIGNNCTIHQCCTLGDRNGGRPILGQNVTVYAGALILGDICIGSNSIIGANSVVMQSFPNNSIIIGTPAKNIRL